MVDLHVGHLNSGLEGALQGLIAEDEVFDMPCRFRFSKNVGYLGCVKPSYRDERAFQKLELIGRALGPKSGSFRRLDVENIRKKTTNLRLSICIAKNLQEGTLGLFKK